MIPTAPVNRLTLREQVLEALRSAIVGGAFRPGASLIETELAEAYQVSRGTVREALRSLQQAGLVEGDARGRLRVRRPSAQEVRELFNVRAALETLAIREIIASGDIDRVVAELEAALPLNGSSDFAEALNADLAFHDRLCELSGNTTLHQLWRGLEGRMRIVLFSGEVDRPSLLMSADRHRPFVDAIADGDATRVYEVVTAHMTEAAEHWARVAETA